MSSVVNFKLVFFLLGLHYLDLHYHVMPYNTLPNNESCQGKNNNIKKIVTFLK